MTPRGKVSPTEDAPSGARPFKDRAIETSLIEAAKIGIGIQQQYHRKLESIEKKGRVDLVTRADKEAEQKVFEYLTRRHPEHALIGEESYDGNPSAPAGYAWVLDPVDGTTNYAHGLDHYGFSLGVLYDGDPVAGVVYDPGRDHAYHAYKGRGAFRNKEVLHVSENARLVDSLVATGFPYDRRKKMPELLALFGAFMLKVQDIRRFGVASLDLAFVAAGNFDGYFENPLNAWDIAAGVLLVTEAGGKITDYDGRPLNLFKPGVVASNGRIHAAMLRTIRQARESALSK